LREMSLGLFGGGRLEAGCLGPAEGVEIRPNVLNSFVIESLYRRLAALRGIDFQLHQTAIRFQDRKSTRLNSSHVAISYAVFCLLSRHLTATLFPYTTLFRSPYGR